jgi:lactate dehydrogenase-like 2-hydroxyacid dehydrogenase
VEVWPGRLPPDPEQLRAGAEQAEGLLALLTDRVDEALLAACPRLRAIANYAVGVDNIDLAATSRRGIAVGNTPDVLTEATADLAFALLLAAARRLPEALLDAAGGDWVTWEPGRWLGADVAGATLGIVGMGRIGRAVARRGEGFAMEIVYAGGSDGASDAPVGDPPPGRRLPLAQLLSRADFVTLHCPLTEATRHLIDAEALRLMKPSAILVNTARGAIVDQAALARALREEEIAGAAIDVTDPEPPAAEDPLFDSPNLIVTPHIGSATWGTRSRMAEIAVENLLAALAGRPMPHPA